MFKINYGKISQKLCLTIFISLTSFLFADFTEDPMIEFPVKEMFADESFGLAQDDMIYLTYDEEPGGSPKITFLNHDNILEYYDYTFDLGFYSFAPDYENDRILCLIGMGASNSDGLYQFDINTKEFSMIQGAFISGGFVKKLISGFYFSHDNGLRFSEDGTNWSDIDFFENMIVTDIEETTDGKLFIVANSTLYLEVEDGFDMANSPLNIVDIFIRSNDEVYIACGSGSDSDAIHRVEFDDSEIIDFTFINWFSEPQKIHEYSSTHLVAGCNGEEGKLYLFEPELNGEKILIDTPVNVSSINCFTTLPIYCHNFVVGTNAGAFFYSNLTEIDEVNSDNLLNLKNYPNPFNPKTIISYELPKNSKNAKIEIFNLKGQIIKTIPTNQKSNVEWDGKDSQNNAVSSGIYLYRLKIDTVISQTQKMILMK